MKWLKWLLAVAAGLAALLFVRPQLRRRRQWLHVEQELTRAREEAERERETEAATIAEADARREEAEALAARVRELEEDIAYVDRRIDDPRLGDVERARRFNARFDKRGRLRRPTQR